MASTVIVPGTISAGAVVSCTTTAKVPVELLPDESVAVHETVVVPIAKVAPDGGLQLG